MTVCKLAYRLNGKKKRETLNAISLSKAPEKRADLKSN